MPDPNDFCRAVGGFRVAGAAPPLAASRREISESPGEPVSSRGFNLKRIFMPAHRLPRRPSGARNCFFFRRAASEDVDREPRGKA